MTRYLLSMGLCLGLAMFAVSESDACKPRPCGVQPAPGPRPLPAPQPAPGPRPVAPTTPATADNGGGSEVVWDLPETEKRRIREAIRARTIPGATLAERPTLPPVQTPVARPTTPVGPGQETPDAVARALAAHKALAAQVTRLLAKRGEIQRWDSQTQDKFRQAFGSVDENLRARVLQRIDQEVQQRTRLMAALADNIRFEFYVARNKQR